MHVTLCLQAEVHDAFWAITDNTEMVSHALYMHKGGARDLFRGSGRPRDEAVSAGVACHRTDEPKPNHDVRANHRSPYLKDWR